MALSTQYLLEVGLRVLNWGSNQNMSDDILSDIADEIGVVTEEQNEEDKAREGEEFDPEDYHRDRDDEYEGNR